MKNWRAYRMAMTASLLLAALLGAGLVHAATLRPLALKELVRKADLITLGVVRTQQARFRDGQNIIVTDVEVEPHEVLKGQTPLYAPLLVTHLGGVVGEIGLRVPGEASFQDGEAVLLFLQRSQGSSHLRVIGMSQGKYHLEGLPADEPWEATDRSSVLSQRADSAETQPLAELLDEIQALLTPNTP